MLLNVFKANLNAEDIELAAIQYLMVCISQKLIQLSTKIKIWENLQFKTLDV